MLSYTSIKVSIRQAHFPSDLTTLTDIQTHILKGTLGSSLSLLHRNFVTFPSLPLFAKAQVLKTSKVENTKLWPLAQTYPSSAAEGLYEEDILDVA